MKAKTIRKALSGKIEDWIESIDDKEAQEAAKRSTMVTGGAIVSMLEDEDVNDYDVYFRDRDDAELIAQYYVEKMSGYNIELGFPEAWKYQDNADHDIDEDNRIYINVPNGIQEISKDWQEDSRYNPVFVSNNAITLEGDIQLIFRFIGDPEEIHENYDFVHCTNYWTREGNNLVLQKEALESILTKELHYVGSKYPVCSIFRIRKYLDRGYRINAGELLKISFQVNKLNLSDINVLREQLVGVDIHYFSIIVNALLSKKEEEGDDFKVTESYLFTLINKVFN